MDASTPTGASPASTQMPLDFLAAGGEMGALMRAHDWSGSPLGPPADWPQALRTAVGILVNSRYPMFLAWGPELALLYNDAYMQVLGRKHPAALGNRFDATWAEIWQDILPLVERALSGEPTWSENMPLTLTRRGFHEEAFFTFSYSPLFGESGRAEGMFCACIETTEGVVSERRLRTLNTLSVAAVGAQASTVAETEAACIAALGQNPADVPFALLYRFEGDDRVALSGSAGVQAADLRIAQSSRRGGPWPLARVAEGEAEWVRGLSGQFAEPPRSVSGQPVECAAILPIPPRAAGETRGALVLGLNPRQPLDDAYRLFLDRVAAALAAASTNARAFEAERLRAETLAEVDRVKTAFFANVSHEFRTPLTLMLGPLEELRRDFASGAAGLTPEQFAHVDIVHRNGLRLQRLVNALLDFSRIESGRAVARFEPTDLGAFTAEIASMFRSATDRAGLVLTVDAPAMQDPAWVDRDLWEKVVLNLLSNAFKYTFGGSIVVAVRKVGPSFELVVRDTGVGIPSDEIPRLFERFHRVPGARGRTHEGTGIGLSMVRELVRMHGGTIEVESAYGVGSTFRVTLPAGSAHLPAAQVGDAGGMRAAPDASARAVVDEALRWLTAEARDDDRVDSAEASSTAAQRPRVLVADDNADMRDYLRRLLGRDYDVEVVTNGREALDAIGRRMPDLVLSDVMMPALDGHALVARLRADARTASLPVLLLSARAGDQATVEGLAAGADDYLTKPFSARELLAHVAMQIKLNRIRFASDRALRIEQERWRHAALIGRFGHWLLDLASGAIEASDAYKANLGLQPSAQLTWARVLEMVHPDDRARAERTLHAAVAARAEYVDEFRVLWGDGTLHWLSARGSVHCTPDGTPFEMRGVNCDVTAQHFAKESRESVRRVHDVAPPSGAAAVPE